MQKRQALIILYVLLSLLLVSFVLLDLNSEIMCWQRIISLLQEQKNNEITPAEITAMMVRGMGKKIKFVPDDLLWATTTGVDVYELTLANQETLYYSKRGVSRQCQMLPVEFSMPADVTEVFVSWHYCHNDKAHYAAVVKKSDAYFLYLKSISAGSFYPLKDLPTKSLLLNKAGVPFIALLIDNSILCLDTKALTWQPYNLPAEVVSVLQLNAVYDLNTDLEFSFIAKAIDGNNYFYNKRTKQLAVPSDTQMYLKHGDYLLIGCSTMLASSNVLPNFLSQKKKSQNGLEKFNQLIWDELAQSYYLDISCADCCNRYIIKWNWHQDQILLKLGKF